MAHKTLVNGTAYDITGGKTLVNGTAYSIKGGKTLVGGAAYDISFAQGVYLVYNGAALEIPVSEYIGSTWGEATENADIYVDAGVLYHVFELDVHPSLYPMGLYTTDVYDNFGIICDENGIVVLDTDTVFSTTYYLYEAAIEWNYGMSGLAGIELPVRSIGLTWADVFIWGDAKFRNEMNEYFWIYPDDSGSLLIRNEAGEGIAYLLSSGGTPVTSADTVLCDCYTAM